MQDDVEDMLGDCEAREGKLTKWEAGFVQSLRERTGEGKGVTDKQYVTLSQIWDKVTSDYPRR